MTSDPQTPPHKRLLHTAKEYLTHWFSAGVILTLTGFTPDHWVANVFHAVKLDSLLEALPAMDYRLMAVGLGVGVSTGALIFQSQRARKAAPAVQAAPALDDIEGKPSIAVLPFVNLSSDPEQEYFADGMTEDIITGLSCDSRLFVTARSSTFAYKGQSPDIRAAGRELGVRYVVEGSIRPIGERLRITAQLIETATGAHVWADKIDRPVAEIFAVMDEVVDEIISALCSSLGVAEAARAGRQRPENLQAWALCVQAEVLWNTQATPKAILEAEKLARRAAEIEPGYAAGWALLACFAAMRITYGTSIDLVRDSAEALSLARKALDLAPNDPVVLGCCGYAACFAGQAAQGVEWAQRSLALNPNNNFSRQSYAFGLLNLGRPGEALAQVELFLRRSPKDPYVGFAYIYQSYGHLALGDAAKAEQAARNCVAHMPGFGMGHLTLAIVLGVLQRDAEAQVHIGRLREVQPGWTREQAIAHFKHTSPSGRAGKMTALINAVWRD